MLDAGIESRILTRLQPAHECGCNCELLEDEDNLLCDKEDYLETTECASKVLGCLTTSLFVSPRELQAVRCFDELTSPTRSAMWYV